MRVSQRAAMLAFLDRRPETSQDARVASTGEALRAGNVWIARWRGRHVEVVECAAPWVARRVQDLQRLLESRGTGRGR